MDATLTVGVLASLTAIVVTLLKLYHRNVESFLRRLLRRRQVADGEEIRGVDAIRTPPHVIRVDSSYNGRKVIAFDEMLGQIRSTVVRPLKRQGWIPDLVVGSARGGAICAAIIAANMMREAKRRPLRVVDRLHEGTHPSPDLNALMAEDIAGAARILIVESSRKTGATFHQIVEKLRSLNPSAEIKDFALVWAPSDVDQESEPPGMYSYLSDGLNPARLKLPWYF